MVCGWKTQPGSSAPAGKSAGARAEPQPIIVGRVPPDPLPRRLRLTVAYDGGSFAGWQSQARGNTVQDHLETAFAALCGGQRIAVHGSGRTDAGVHARGQIAHADVPPGSMTLERWRLALNAHLPPQIRVTDAAFARGTFHARFDARGKIYVYRIWNSPVLDPFERGRAWHLPGPLSLAALTAAVGAFQGRHDFAAFAANRGTPPETTVRTIRRVRVAARGPLITLRFEGDGFLYRMVRLMVGSAVRCAQDRAAIPSIVHALEAGDAAKKTTFCAPAEGLCLMRVLYGSRPSAAGASAARGGKTSRTRSKPRAGETS